MKILIITFCFFSDNGFQESVSTFGTVAGFWSSAYSLGYSILIILICVLLKNAFKMRLIIEKISI